MVDPPKTTLSEENNKVVDVSVEDDDFRPGDPPKLTTENDPVRY